MVATTFDAVADKNSDLVFKPLKGAVLIAPYSTAIPTSFTAGAGASLEELTGFKSLGLISKDNPPSFAPTVETSEVEAWGELEPPRTDITSRQMSVSFTTLETRREALELFSGVDLSATEADAVTHEIAWNDATSPSTTYYRLIFLAVDGSGANAKYFFKILPKANVTDITEQSWAEDSAMTYGFSFAPKIDPTLGYSVRNVIGGPGVTSQLVTSMGFTVATP
ncbi:hypothetical protein QNA24_30265 [Rhodococcus qingshengii]|uniref:phage tail tube protein n=1 Tax=Rhodococcus TaxID=1827 RepID=UPI001E42F0ED|nr:MULTISPECIES: hypothetical protein [Rhodococcus]MCD2099535.1 hypothetical protein [Rhodococcus rhodochrous]MCD2123903.1 hypothetical protein [Rhodococcus rhodochrous]MCQ4136670.1 hypothetical protein [Rhodococcus rhodochrous]MDJ0490669.1 hypothetical protein [Rhodococcus qingshengii]